MSLNRPQSLLSTLLPIHH